jgi:hypothetical protein
MSWKLFDQTISTLLEQEGGHAETAESASCAKDDIGALPQGVAYEYERAHLEQLGFLAGMAENLLDLGLTGATHDRRHDLGELCGAGDPA